jgi:hypothetical protein
MYLSGVIPFLVLSHASSLCCFQTLLMKFKLGPAAVKTQVWMQFNTVDTCCHHASHVSMFMMLAQSGLLT